MCSWGAQSRHQVDRRRNLLCLTPAGSNLLAELTPRAKWINEQLLGSLPKEDQATALRLLCTVADSDTTQPPGPNGK